MSHDPQHLRWAPHWRFDGRLLARAIACTVLLVSVCLILHTYTVYGPTADEGDHIAGGMEWLSHSTFNMDPIDPPLPRVIIALGPYIMGVRPSATGNPWAPNSEWGEGGRILHSGNFRHILYEARAGTLLFFIFSVYLVWSRTRLWIGESYAYVAVVLFCLLPPILTHASLATTDVAAMCMFFWALDRVWRLCRSSTLKNALAAGIVIGLAITTKFTIGPFLAISILLILMTDIALKRIPAERWHFPPLRRILVSAIACALIVWGMYFFSIGSIVPVGSKDRTSLSNFLIHRHIPQTPVLLLADHVPAVPFFQGLRLAVEMNRHHPPNYFMGRLRPRGSLLFFPVMFAVKMPLPFLALSLIGIGLACWQIAHLGDSYLLWLVVGAFSPFVMGIGSTLNIGMRHVLAATPFLAILAAFAVRSLWQSGTARLQLRLLVVLLVSWQGVNYARTASNPLSWFNEAAMGHGPWFATDSDFDWGQDLSKLPAALNRLGAHDISLAYSGAADPRWYGLQSWRFPPPKQTTYGWIAISEFIVRTGGDAYAWLDAYKPVGYAGRSIRIYCIPNPGKENTHGTDPVCHQ